MGVCVAQHDAVHMCRACAQEQATGVNADVERDPCFLWESVGHATAQAAICSCGLAAWPLAAFLTTGPRIAAASLCTREVLVPLPRGPDQTFAVLLGICPLYA